MAYTSGNHARRRGRSLVEDDKWSGGESRPRRNPDIQFALPVICGRRELEKGCRADTRCRRPNWRSDGVDIGPKTIDSSE